VVGFVDYTNLAQFKYLYNKVETIGIPTSKAY